MLIRYPLSVSFIDEIKDDLTTIGLSKKRSKLGKLHIGQSNGHGRSIFSGDAVKKLANIGTIAKAIARRLISIIINLQ